MPYAVINITDAAKFKMIDRSAEEVERAREAVRTPDRTETCPAGAPAAAAAAHLFAKRFGNRMTLVSGRPSSPVTFDVFESYMIDLAAIGADDNDSLVQLLDKFANTYGFDITVGAFTAKFFAHTRIAGSMAQAQALIQAQIPDRKSVV